MEDSEAMEASEVMVDLEVTDLDAKVASDLVLADKQVRFKIVKKCRKPKKWPKIKDIFFYVSFIIKAKLGCTLVQYKKFYQAFTIYETLLIDNSL